MVSDVHCTVYNNTTELLVGLLNLSTTNKTVEIIILFNVYAARIKSTHIAPQIWYGAYNS